MQAFGDGVVEESLDIAYAGEGKFHVCAKFSLDGEKSFEIEPLKVGGVQMWPKPPEIAGNTMTCIFEATSHSL